MLGPATTALLLLAPLAARAQVTATGPNGPTNPSAPGLGAHNQTSESRLVSLNSVEDFCLFAPSMPNSAIGNVEAEVVAWCTKERNGARLIPDGCVPFADLEGRGSPIRRLTLCGPPPPNAEPSPPRTLSRRRFTSKSKAEAI
jgi:hypothetical protein